MSTADHATCCCADTLAEVARLTGERDRARALAIRLEAEAAQPYLPAQMPEAVPREGQEGAGSAPSRAADDWSARDLAGDLLTLQPVDPTRCNPRRKVHPVIGGRALECSECWRERVAERLEQLRRSGTPAAGEARKSAESDADDDAEWDAREAIERARGGR